MNRAVPRSLAVAPQRCALSEGAIVTLHNKAGEMLWADPSNVWLGQFRTIAGPVDVALLPVPRGDHAEASGLAAIPKHAHFVVHKGSDGACGFRSVGCATLCTRRSLSAFLFSFTFARAPSPCENASSPPVSFLL